MLDKPELKVLSGLEHRISLSQIKLVRGFFCSLPHVRELLQVEDRSALVLTDSPCTLRKAAGSTHNKFVTTVAYSSATQADCADVIISSKTRGVNLLLLPSLARSAQEAFSSVAFFKAGSLLLLLGSSPLVLTPKSTSAWNVLGVGVGFFACFLCFVLTDPSQSAFLKKNTTSKKALATKRLKQLYWWKTFFSGIFLLSQMGLQVLHFLSLRTSDLMPRGSATSFLLGFLLLHFLSLALFCDLTR